MLGGRPASHISRTTSSSGPLVWMIGPSVPCLRRGPVDSELTANWGCKVGHLSLPGQPQDLCLPKGGGPAPRGAQSSAGLGLVRRENRVSRGWVSKSEHSTSGQGHLSRHTREALREKKNAHRSISLLRGGRGAVEAPLGLDGLVIEQKSCLREES